MSQIVTYNTRMSQKHDIKANWDKIPEFVPIAGEIIIYDDLNKIKIGDGRTPLINLDYSLQEICVGNGDMPEGATIQILTDDSDVEQSWKDELKEYIDGEIADELANISGRNITAEVGQTIVVKAVDENGKPTEWESTDYQPRTHYSEYTELFPETTVTLDENGEFAVPVDFEFTTGNTYTVSYNGTKYIVTAFDVVDGSGKASCIGNGAVLGLADTGEPFVASVLEGVLTGISLEEVTEFTFKIEGEHPHKIDKKYIPRLKLSEQENDLYYPASRIEVLSTTSDDYSTVESLGVCYKGPELNLSRSSEAVGYEAILTSLSDGSQTIMTESNNPIIYVNDSGIDGYIVEGYFTILNHVNIDKLVNIDNLDEPDTLEGDECLIVLDEAVINLSALFSMTLTLYTTIEAKKISSDYLDLSVFEESVTTAQTTADNARFIADNAQLTAGYAQTIANNAQTTANNAQTTADNARTTADNARLIAVSARTTANNAKATAENSVQKATTDVNLLVSLLESIVMGLEVTEDQMNELRDVLKAQKHGFVRENGEICFYLGDGVKLTHGVGLYNQSIVYYENGNMQTGDIDVYPILRGGAYHFSDTDGAYYPAQNTEELNHIRLMYSDSNGEIVEKNGVLYFYRNGILTPGAGLVPLLDENYNRLYFIVVKDNGSLRTGFYWIEHYLCRSGLLAGGHYDLGDDGFLKTYKVTYNLTNVSSNYICQRIATQKDAETGGVVNQSIGLFTFDDHVISAVTVTMGGEDITSTAYADGIITLGEITGDVVITASASPAT